MTVFRTKPSVWDAFAALAVVLLACACLLLPLLWQKTGTVLLISTSEGTHEYALDTDRKITVTSNGITLEVVIRNGAAYVRESECEDGVCRASGKISRSGESIVCAPAGVRLLVKGGERDVDFVAG